MMYKRAGFFQELSFKRNRTKKNLQNYEDIYDGQIYKEMCQNGFLSEPNNISFTWNSDGARVFKSATFEIWPFYLVINELPYRLRFKQQNLIVAGLWFGKSKPCQSLFLSAFHSDLSALYDGVELHVPGNQELVTVKGRLLCGTCDLPAKALFMNFVGHSGYYGCPVCLLRGERSERTENQHSYPYAEAPLRNDADTIRYAEMAEAGGAENVFGVKGHSALRLFIENYVTSTATDIVHCGWNGLRKKLLELWFDSKFSDQNFSLTAVSARVNELLVVITPPSYVKRMPGSISEHLAFWKAHEFKAWLLYYSVPILSSVMNPEYLDHHLMLVHAFFLLNQDSISEGMVQEAESCLKNCVIKFQDLYGLRYMSLNIHLLLHLPDYVRKFGPLWTVSSMPFENFNGQLVRLVHGTRYSALQIASSFSQFANLPVMISRLQEGDQIRTWCENLLNRQKINITERIEPGVGIVGRCKPMARVPPLIREALANAGTIARKVAQFFKLKKGPVTYFSRAYERQLKTSSIVAKFNHNGRLIYGVIYTFVRVSDCECDDVCQCLAEHYALMSLLDCVNPFHIIHPAVPVSHVHRCTESDQYIAVKVKCLRAVCFSVHVFENRYVMDPVNTLEDE